MAGFILVSNPNRLLFQCCLQSPRLHIHCSPQVRERKGSSSVSPGVGRLNQMKGIEMLVCACGGAGGHESKRQEGCECKEWFSLFEYVQCL